MGRHRVHSRTNQKDEEFSDALLLLLLLPLPMQEYVAYSHTGRIIPAIWFRYDLSPITVKYTERRQPLYRFITTVREPGASAVWLPSSTTSRRWGGISSAWRKKKGGGRSKCKRRRVCPPAILRRSLLKKDKNAHYKQLALEEKKK